MLLRQNRFIVRLSRSMQRFEDFDLGPNRIHQNFRRRTASIHFAFDDDDLPDGHLLAVFVPGLGEEHEIDVALNIFDVGETHRLAGLGGAVEVGGALPIDAGDREAIEDVGNAVREQGRGRVHHLEVEVRLQGVAGVAHPPEHLAARYPDRWRAIAPISGPFVDAKTYPFERIRPLPIFMTEGTAATPSLAGSRALAKFLTDQKFDFRYLEVDGNHGSMVPMIWPAMFEYFDAHR